MIGRKGIVVEPGSREVRGVLFSSRLGRTKVERKASAPSVEELLSGFPSDAPVTLVLPGYLFMARTVTLPFTDAKIVRKSLLYEMEGIVPLPIDEILVDSVPSCPADKGSRVMALAIPKSTIADWVTRFPEGRRPERVVPDFIPLLALGMNIRRENGIYGLLRIESESASIVLISGGRPLVMRSIKADGDAPIAEWVEATIKPLRDEGRSVETLYVIGAAAREAVGALAPVLEVVPLSETVGGVSGREWPAWSTLAGGAVSVSEFPRFNILGVSPADGRRARIVRTLSIGTGVLLILGTADLYVRHTTAARAVSALKAESREVFLSAMPHVKNVVKEDAQLRVALVKAKETKAVMAGRPSRSYLAIWRGLERLVVGHPGLRVREAAVEGDRLSVAGDGRGGEAEGLRKLFAGIDGAAGAQVEEIVQGAEPNSYRFRVRVQVP